MTPPAPTGTLEEVRRAEVQYIAARRRLLDPQAPKQDPGLVGETLIGLALSGGGIRSATTNLGLLQALARMRILPCVDYLCTVSGGGYIGGCLSALLSVNKNTGGPWRPEQHHMTSPGEALFTTAWGAFPFRDEQGDWPTSGRHEVKHLRTHGNFLVTRKGFVTTETLRSIGGIITGIVYHWLMFVLALAIIAAFGLWLTLGVLAPESAGLFEPASVPLSATVWDSIRPTLALIGPALTAAAANWWHINDGPFRIATRCGALVALAVFAFMWLAMPAYRRWGHPQEGESIEDAFHRRLLKWIRRAGLLVLGYAAIRLRLGYAPYAQGQIDPLAWLFLPLALGLGFWVTSLALYITLPWGEIAGGAGARGWPLRQFWTRQFRSAWGSVVALGLYWVVGAAALAIFPFAAFVVDNVSGRALVAALTAALASRGIATRVGGIPGVRSWLSPSVKKTVLGILVGVLVTTVVALLGGLFVSWPLTDTVAWLGSWMRELPAWLVGSSFGQVVAKGASYVILAVGAFLLLGVVGIVGNANKIGLHYFYRDRLIETFLRTEVTNKRLTLDLADDAMDMRLKELHGTYKLGNRPPDFSICATTAPYLLVSCAINLAERRDLTRKDRKSGYFTFSKLYCGSYHTGYRATTEYQAGEVKLGRALTISGAAVGSGMGYQTFFAQAFATTLFNLRLGYWMENPGRPLRFLPGRPERPIFSPWYLLREMLSWTHARGRLINLSDGGHTGDNVGIYPLLQRRCKVIIACDAEADPRLAFASFTEALRHAYIDMTIDVDIDLTMIRPDPVTGHSRSHCAVGRIRYPDAGRGAPAEAWLIYMKNSLTGDEPEPIKNYRVTHATFPHEATVDQFFDDAQFESYRALGDHLAEHTFQPVLGTDIPFSDQWLRRLSATHSSFKAVDHPDYLRAMAALAQIEQEIAANPNLHWYWEECYPATVSLAAPQIPASRASAIPVFIKQARLMEQVYLSLELHRHANAPENRGWINVFRSWGGSPTFQDAFIKMADLFALEFVRFYEAYIKGRPPIDREPIPHPWDVNFPAHAERIFLDPGRREVR